MAVTFYGTKTRDILAKAIVAGRKTIMNAPCGYQNFVTFQEVGSSKTMLVKGPMINGPIVPVKLSFGMIVILSDGSIEKLPGFTTMDEAALQFWEAVERLAPNFLKSKMETKG